MQGLVIKNTGSWYTVLTDDGQLLDCKVKGNFRIKGIRSTNPVAVGDRVTVGEGNWITEIEDRKNYIIRKSINLSKQSHILAANVDQALLVVTVARPETSTTFIDRFLASAEAYRVPVILVFNKSDVLSDEEAHYQQMMIDLYENIGYECHAISAQTGAGVEPLRPKLEGKITLLSGNSGVGKSTLINHLLGDDRLDTNGLRNDDKGRHTTTHRELLMLPSGTMVIDTPGMREMGMWDSSEGLSAAFEDIEELSAKCRFKNCTHKSEPGCAVQAAIKNGELSEERLSSYEKLKIENAYSEDAEGYLAAKEEKFKKIAKFNKTNHKN